MFMRSCFTRSMRRWRGGEQRQQRRHDFINCNGTATHDARGYHDDDELGTLRR